MYRRTTRAPNAGEELFGHNITGQKKAPEGTLSSDVGINESYLWICEIVFDNHPLVARKAPVSQSCKFWTNGAVIFVFDSKGVLRKTSSTQNNMGSGANLAAISPQGRPNPLQAGR